MSMEVCPVSRKLPEYPDICKLLKTAFPRSEQIPVWILQLLAFRKDVNFRAFYDEDQFCGVLYTAEDDKYIFVLYLAVHAKVQSKGYGSMILRWLQKHSSKNIVLNVEAENPSAENANQRENRIRFYCRNGITDTGYLFQDAGETYSVLASDCNSFIPQEYERLLKRFSFILYQKSIRKS